MSKLTDGIKHFRTAIYPKQQSLYASLAGGQNPETLFITCSDSRISPGQMTHSGPGDLFIVRNAGNIVPPFGAAQLGGEGATIEYAVANLGVKDIVICGHTHCGAMNALRTPDALKDLPELRRWLGLAESTRRIVEDCYKDASPEDRLTILAEENVLVQVENLRTHPAVRSAISRGEVSIHAWMFKIPTAEVFEFNPESGRFELYEGGKPTRDLTTPMRRLDAPAI